MYSHDLSSNFDFVLIQIFPLALLFLCGATFCFLAKLTNRPYHEIHVFQVCIHYESSEPHRQRLKRPTTLRQQPSLPKQALETYATRTSFSTSSARLTARGCSSLSTPITCLAIAACLGDAKGTRTVLYMSMLSLQIIFLCMDRLTSCATYRGWSTLWFR